MKALKFKGTFNVNIENVADLHALKANDVIVEVKYCGICGTDVGIITGDYPVALPGVTLGHEATGIIKEVGNAVNNVKVGDRVVINPTSYCGECRMCKSLRINHCERKMGTESGVSYDGTFADYYRTTSDYVHRLPDNASMKAMALTEPLSCTLAGVRKIPQNLLSEYTYVLGAGPMGILYTWALTLKGAHPVVIENSLARQEFVKDCLPPGVAMYASLDEARVRHFNDRNAPVDVVIDTTSGLLNEIYPVLACGGVYMSIGLKEKHCEINTIKLADKSLSVIGSIDSLHGTFVESFNLLKNGIIPGEKIISHVIPMSEYRDGFVLLGCDIEAKKMTGNVARSGKILLEI